MSRSKMILTRRQGRREGGYLEMEVLVTDWLGERCHDTGDMCEKTLLELKERRPLRNSEGILAIRWRRDVEMEDPDVEETMDREYIRLVVTFVSRF